MMTIWTSKRFNDGIDMMHSIQAELNWCFQTSSDASWDHFVRKKKGSSQLTSDMRSRDTETCFFSRGLSQLKGVSFRKSQPRFAAKTMLTSCTSSEFCMCQRPSFLIHLILDSNTCSLRTQTHRHTDTHRHTRPRAHTKEGVHMEGYTDTHAHKSTYIHKHTEPSARTQARTHSSNSGDGEYKNRSFRAVAGKEIDGQCYATFSLFVREGKKEFVRSSLWNRAWLRTSDHAWWSALKWACKWMISSDSHLWLSYSTSICILSASILALSMFASCCPVQYWQSPSVHG